MHQTTIDKLTVTVYPDRREMGRAAAQATANCMRELLEQQEAVNMIFAAAASQVEFLDALVQSPRIDWNRVNGFHMDEYIGLPPSHPQRFGRFLCEKIFDRVPFRQVFYLDENGTGGEEDGERYAALLRQYPVDITCMGIGENTHLAFNDPHVADFRDLKLVKRVDLDEACKQQQVHDGCFPEVEEVPSWAFTLTIPALMQAQAVFCMVPGRNKAQAVRYTLTEPVSERYPSTILRTHPRASLFLDRDSAGEWQPA